MNDKVSTPFANSDSTEDGSLASVSNALTDLVTGIPAPVRNNALKAFGRLCTAAIEIPAVYLEGIAEERRAESSARVRLIKAVADQVAGQLTVDPSYAHAAVKKFGARVLREQINLDMVSEAAAADLRSKAEPAESGSTAKNDGPAISEDWLNAFEREASQKTTAEMQLLFGRILAGEIRKPTRFSIRTVKLASELDTSTASLFLRLCSLSISLRAKTHILDARVFALGGNASVNSISQYGLNFDQLNILHEYGLIIPDYNSYYDYSLAVTNSQGLAPLGITYQNRTWVLVPSTERAPDQELRLSGVRLSKAGVELLPILDLQVDDSYTAALTDYFSKINLQLTEVVTKHE